MSEIKLVPFENSSAPAIEVITSFHDHGDALIISYKVVGELLALDLGTTPKHYGQILRTMKLWEKTCFELFIKNSRDQYLEFNFSPMFEWNAFYFEKKGDPLKEWEAIKSVNIDILNDLEVFQLIAKIKKADLPENFFVQTNAAISSVIKEKSGTLSYWAITHPDVRPNFHHFDSFKL